MITSPVIQVAPSDTRKLKQFVALERQLNSAYSLFVADIDADIIKRLSGRSAFFEETELTLFFAYDGSRPVARCAALINRRFQRARNESIGCIGYFAAAAGVEAPVRAMLAAAEQWLQERGVTRIVAPFNGVASMGLGVLTSAFDEEPMFPSVWQPPFYAEYLSGAGYEARYPLWYYTIDFGHEAYRTARAQAVASTAVVRPVDKKQWHRDLDTFRQLFNRTFEEEWEFYSLSNAEFHEFFDPLKPVLDTRQMLIAEVDGEPAGFCLGLPDWTPLFRSFEGRLGPLQILKLMLRANRFTRAGLIAIGALPAYRGTGLARKLAFTLYDFYEQRGLRQAFYYPVNEANLASRRFAESLGGTGRVLYHCYEKRLDIA